MPDSKLEKALARIAWQGRNGHLGVELVNHGRERFFLFAEVFLGMMRHTDEYVLVKHRDRRPDQAINHHGGAIWGDVAVGDSTSVISLHFGAVYKDIEYCPKSCELRHVLGDQRYRVETRWLRDLAKVIERQLAEERKFELLSMDADVTPLQTSFIGG